MDEERQMILRMLKEGKVSVEEADALLEALGERRAEEDQEEHEVPEALDVPRVKAEAKLPKVELSGLRAEISKVISEIMESVPREIVKGIKEGAGPPWRRGFSDFLHGLSGLAEGTAEFRLVDSMQPGESLEIRNAWGDVDMSPGSGDTMELTGVARVWGTTSEEARRMAQGLDVRSRRHGSSVIVEVPRLEGWRVRVDLKVAVPSGVNVRLGEAKGDLRATGLTGDLQMRIASGDLQVENHRGEIDLEVKSGDLALREIEGNVHLDVKSGDVTAAKVMGAVGAETKSGDIDLRELQSDSVHVRAISGDVAVGPVRFAAGEISVDTVSGDIEIALPPDTQATIEASVRSGEIDCTLPLKDRSGDRRTLRGVFNAPGGRVTLHALSGDIDIREMA